MPILPDVRIRPAPPEMLAAYERRIRAAFSSGPILVPYEVWSMEVDAHCREHRITLACPANIQARLWIPTGEMVTVSHLLQYQELSYRRWYEDPQFTIDPARLSLPRDRLDDILTAIARKEVDYPLVTCLPRTLTKAEGKHTLHRVLMDRLIRGQRIAVYPRSDPDVDTLLEQVRDLTLADLTIGPEGWKARGNSGIAPDGQQLAFDQDHWLPYLRALYPTLPRPAAIGGYTDLSFVAWERDPPASRVIPNATGPHGGAVTIQGKPQLDAVRHRYPLITPSRHLALFSQHHAATGEYLDTNTWSWTFGIVDPQRFPGEPSVRVDWGTDGLDFFRRDPRHANADGRLRGAR